MLSSRFYAIWYREVKMSYEEEMFDKHKGQIIRVLKRANKTKYYSALFEKCGLIIDDSMKLSDFKKIPTTDKNCYNQNRYDMIAMDLVGFDKDELAPFINSQITLLNFFKPLFP